MNGVSCVNSASLHPLQALGKNEQALVGHLDDFVHHRQGADGVKIGGLGGIDAGFPLRHHHNGLVFAQRIDQLNRALPAHGQGQHGVREKHRIPHRQDGQNPAALLSSFGFVLRSVRVFSAIFHLECLVLKF